MMDGILNKSVITFWVLLFCFASAMHSKTVRAPLSDEYQEYLTNDDLWQGYIPSPLRLKYNDVEPRSSKLLPSHFDLRNVSGKNYITPVRNQLSYGTCWAFSALASIESVWKRNGFGDSFLSTRNMVNCHGFVWDAHYGGNQLLSTAYLTRFAGPVPEVNDPYSQIGELGCLEVDKGFIPRYACEAWWIGGGVDAIKEAVYKSGSVSTWVYGEGLLDNYDKSNFTSYYNGNKIADHGVAIIGWNDTIVVTGKDSGSAPKPGAWIVKNSWGTSFGDKGYFYVSYYDKYVGKFGSCFPYYVEKSEVDTLFMNDEIGAISSTGFTDAANEEVGYAMVKFDIDEPWFVNRIGTYFNTGSGFVDLFVGTQLVDGILQDTIAKEEGLFIPNPGYFSFQMPALIDAKNLYVIVKYTTPNYTFPIPIECEVPNFCEPIISAIGNQWISADGKTWEDVGVGVDNNFDLCVRVYARRPAKKVLAYFEPLKVRYCVGDTVKVNSSIQGDPDSLVWILSHDDSYSFKKQSATSESPMWKIDTPGVYSLKLIAFNSLSSDTIFRNGCFEVVDDLSLTFFKSKLTDFVAKGKPISLTAVGAEIYDWLPFDGFAGSSGASMTFLPLQDSIYVKVTARLGACVVTDSVSVNAIEVLYDDVKAARRLNVGQKEGPFTNRYATVEANEPMPQVGICDDQIHWCREGGLHNSIWFTFLAPPSGRVTIDSWGFDNQLALYEVANSNDGWSALLSGNSLKYKLVAANDDYHEEDFSASIIDVVGLEPNKIYYLQMDGSAGGVEGEAYIQINSIASSVPEYRPFEAFVLENGVFKINVSVDNSFENSVVIYNVLGVPCYVGSLFCGENRISTQPFNKGIYTIKVKIGGSYYTDKIVL